MSTPTAPASFDPDTPLTDLDPEDLIEVLKDEILRAERDKEPGYFGLGNTGEEVIERLDRLHRVEEENKQLRETVCRLKEVLDGSHDWIDRYIRERAEGHDTIGWKEALRGIQYDLDHGRMEAATLLADLESTGEDDG